MFDLIRILPLAAAQLHNEPEAICAAMWSYQSHKQDAIQDQGLFQLHAVMYIPRSLRLSVSSHRVEHARISLMRSFWDEISFSGVIDLVYVPPGLIVDRCDTTMISHRLSWLSFSGLQQMSREEHCAVIEASIDTGRPLRASRKGRRAALREISNLS